MKNQSSESEKIVNIYLIIQNDVIKEVKAKVYEAEGTDEEKILFLQSASDEGLELAEVFNSPTNNNGEKITYKIFQKFEKQGMHYNLFEEIFRYFDLGDTPIVCINPVLVD